MRAFDASNVELAGFNLVEASAGTGKTHAITSLVTRLICEQDLGIERVLVVTFTEAAAAELRDRVRARLSRLLRSLEMRVPRLDQADTDLLARMRSLLPDAALKSRLELALGRFDEAAISTIHGFCHRCLTEIAFESGGLFESELVPDLSVLRDEVVRDYWTLETHAAPAEFLQQLAAHKLDLKACQRLADRVVSNPELAVLPRTVDAPMPDRKALERAVDRAREVYDRGEVDRILQRKGVNQVKLKQSNMHQLLDDLEDFLGVRERRSGALADTLPERSIHLAQSRFPMNKGQPIPRHAFFERWETVVEEHAALTDAWRGRLAAFVTGLVDYARREIPKRKLERGLISFDDLLQQLDAALKSPRGPQLADRIRKRFPAALIDEFQDTDSIQWRIFQRLYVEPASPPTTDSADGAGPLFVIGDPKQAIYSFRGADLGVYLRAAQGTAEARRYTMGTNWRTDPALLSALNGLYDAQRLQVPFLVAGIGFPQVSPKPGASERLCTSSGEPRGGLTLGFVDAELSQALGIAELCAREVRHTLASELRIGDQTLTAGDIAVLTRTNAQAFEVQHALNGHGIPSVVLGDQSVFLSTEARELGQLLSALAEPTQVRAVKAALTTELVGVSANGLDALERDDREWDVWTARFRAWNQLWMQRGFVQMVQRVLAELGSFEHLLALTDGERRLTNVLHLIELIHAAARGLHLGPAGILSWLSVQRLDNSQRVENVQVRLESDERAVKITTVHKSKGLEYPVVFCPYAHAGSGIHPDDSRQPVFHDDDGQLTLSLLFENDPKHPHKQRAVNESLEEALRLLYVALTRGKHLTHVFWGPIGHKHQKPYAYSALGYLLHPPDQGRMACDVDRLKAHFKDKTGDDLLREVADLALNIPGLSLRRLDESMPGAPVLGNEREHPLVARARERSIDQYFRTASFSGLAAQAEKLELDPDEGRDRDQGGDLSDAEVDFLTPQLELVPFPRGSKAGNFFHDVLEHHDFTRDEGALKELVKRKLATHGYALDLSDGATSGIQRALATPLFRVPEGRSRAPAPSVDAGPDVDLCLMHLGRKDRLDELEFHFPVAMTPGSERLHSGRLAAAFREHPSPALASGYADRIQQLGFAPLTGFLKGYVDLIFRSPNPNSEGTRRFYLVDYKTNFLGDSPVHYGPRRLQDAMSHGHYYLQYHLYTLALHRYLSSRMPGYRYESDFGGVLYLFLRGMAPELGNMSGIFFEKPPLSRIQALSVVMEGLPQSRPPLDDSAPPLGVDT
ncbi:MAG: exodeoxyribonuclease V subunit beta [Polyangiaceae bacterium]